MPNVSQLVHPVRVKVADDRQLECTEEIFDCVWNTQGHEFATDLKLLPLGAFDVILGQDWLYKHSPMFIDWPTKRLEIKDNGMPVFLQGIGASEVICQSISVVQLAGMHKQGEIEQVLVLSPVDHPDQPTKYQSTELSVRVFTLIH